MIEVDKKTLCKIVPRQNIQGIAERAGVAHSTLCKYLYDNTQPSIGNFKAVAEALGFKLYLIKSDELPRDCVARKFCGGEV